MEVQEIENKLIQLIASITNNEVSAIQPDQTFHDLGIDSLGFVEVLVFIEKNFKLQLITSDLNKNDFATIHTLATFVSKQL